MKIALTGTSGIGKTTLARALSDHFSIKLIEEDVDQIMHVLQVLDKTPQDNKKQVIKAGERLLMTIDEWLKSRMKFFNSTESFVEDRFCIDAIDFLSRSVVGQLREDLLKDLIVTCSNYTATYDLVIVPPISEWSTKQYKNEAGLQRNNFFSNKIRTQSLRIGLLEQFCQAPKLYIHHSCATTEQRLQYVCEVIEKLEKTK